MSDKLRFFAPCPAGVESLLADELRRIGVPGVRPQRSGVLFSGSVAQGLLALAWTRLASRVLLTLAEVDAGNTVALYEGVRELPWEDHVRAGGTIAVDASGTNDGLRNTQFTAVRVKDAVADRFRERFGRRPSVDVREPDLRINVAVRANKATISIDLAGDPLHRRGYRESGVQVEAPMKETLAAAVLEMAGWRDVAESGGGFIDPMCGSGTLAIEAALAAADIAPMLLRASHPVERWLGLDTKAWQAILVEAQERRTNGLAGLPQIHAFDADPRAITIAKACIGRAGLDKHVRLERARLDRLVPPEGVSVGLIATNPPWGERLSDHRELPALYSTLSEQLVPAFVGWRLAVVSPDPGLTQGVGMRARWSRQVGSGKGVATVTLFDVPTAPVATSEPKPKPKSAAEKPAASESRPGPKAATAKPAAKQPAVAKPAAKQPAVAKPATPAPAVDVEPFENRLRKMARHYGKWARRSGVSCYRVYDADLPDFSFAVDVYEGAGPDDGKRWVHVAEYAPPGEIDPAKAAARMNAAVAVMPEVLEVGADNVFVKRRERQRGSAQYKRLSKRGATATVSENGLLFEVNFSDYLDTGLFLDHRDTRAWLRELAEGKRFLNLFAYTGTASVYAAAGDATETVTVDLSATYLSWAQRNLALNGLDTAAHTRVQADTLTWLNEASRAGERFDLVFCDPPTFSNSKRMDGTWDVQRDHAALLADLSGVLAEDGLIVFSCNRRSFTLDEEALSEEGLVSEEVTARTIPRDFERTPGVHKCWTIRRA